jgi:sulfite reductase (ferredoxin)
MPLEELETTLEPLLQAWKAEGRPRSSLGDFVALAGETKIRTLVGARLEP